MKMTISEAIEQMESLIDNANDNLKDPEASDVWKEDVEACNMAIEALKKQDAKKVIAERKGEATRYKCVCGADHLIVFDDTSQFGVKSNYCNVCGQKLDWED